MPSRRRRRGSRHQPSDGGVPNGGSRPGVPATPSQPSNRPPARSRPASSRWPSRSTLLTLGIVAVVVAGVVALMVNGLRQAAASDFEFSVYQGQGELGGEELAFSELFLQGKPVVLNFWAGLCPPCRAEMPGFQVVYEEHQGEFILLGLDVGPYLRLGSNRDARNLLRELTITYPTAHALTRSPVTQYGVVAMPTTLFFTPDQQVFRARQGFLDQSRLSFDVQALIDASATSS